MLTTGGNHKFCQRSDEARFTQPVSRRSRPGRRRRPRRHLRPLRAGDYEPEMELASLLHSQRACLERHSADGLATSGKPVELTVTPLSQDLAARLLAAECHRLKSEHRVLCDESCILLDLSIAEERLHDARPRGRGFYACTARAQELLDELRLCYEKKHDVARQLLALGEEHGALSQASVSVLGTMNTIQRMVITTALEPQDFKDGAVLIKEGEPRDAYFIIVQGQVSCTQRRDPPVRSRPRLWRRPSGAPHSTRAPRHAGASARGRPGALPGKAKASRRETQSATKGPWRLTASSAATRVLPRRPSRALTPQARPGRDRGQARLPADQPAVRVHRDRGR